MHSLVFVLVREGGTPEEARAAANRVLDRQKHAYPQFSETDAGNWKKEFTETAISLHESTDRFLACLTRARTERDESLNFAMQNLALYMDGKKNLVPTPEMMARYASEVVSHITHAMLGRPDPQRTEVDEARVRLALPVLRPFCPSGPTNLSRRAISSTPSTARRLFGRTRKPVPLSPRVRGYGSFPSIFIDAALCHR